MALETGLSGKVALITGGGGGIGRAVALTLAREGARVAVADLNLAAAQAVAREVEAAGAEAMALSLDVTNAEDVSRCMQAVVDRFGALDLLLNGAGILRELPPEEITPEQWDLVLGINLKGTFLCCQAALRVMRRQGSGRIVNIASLAGQIGGIVAGADYAASKAGVICLTKSLAKRTEGLDIRINTVNPGPVHTGMTSPWSQERIAAVTQMTPLRRFADPQDVANVIVFLFSDLARHIHGTHIDVNGGLYMD